MDSSRNSILGGSPRTQHEDSIGNPIIPYPQATLRRRNAFMPPVPSPRNLASAFNPSPRDPFPPTKSPYPSLFSAYSHSRPIPPFAPPVHNIDLTGFWCEPGDHEYKEAANAKGVTNKSPVYWFRETSFGYDNATWRDTEVDEIGINDEWNYPHARSRAKEPSDAETSGSGAVTGGDELIDGNGNARIGRQARGDGRWLGRQADWNNM